MNQDFAVLDGFSEGIAGTVISPDGKALVSGRAQFTPSVAVDPATGTLVLSWLDARHDAARSRVATFLTTSIDGGNTFGAESFANRPLAPVDLATGRPRCSARSPTTNRPATRTPRRNSAIGNHQGLAVYGGHVYPVWASNENGGNDGKASPARYSRGPSHIAAGPRVVNGTMGPVGGPTAPDGGPLARSLFVEFDRPIEPDFVHGGRRPVPGP